MFRILNGSFLSRHLRAPDIRSTIPPSTRRLTAEPNPTVRVAVQVNAETGMGIGYSINSSALITMDIGMVRPSDFATRLLTISSKVVGSSIGMSPGLVPLSILSIK